MFRFFRLPTRVPVRLPKTDASQKLLAAVVIAILATVIAVAWRHTKFISDPMEKLDYGLYDTVYELRTPEDRTNGPVVIVAIDQNSLARLQNGELYDQQPVPYPWPREVYGDIVQYVAKAGARVVSFDMLFTELDKRADYGGDENFAEMVAESKLPVVFGNQVGRDGKPSHFAVPIPDPIFGAVNSDSGVHRAYRPFVHGFPSLGYRAATLFAGSEPEQREPYFAHFYGPHRTASGGTTFRYVRAFDVLAAAQWGAEKAGLDPSIFRGKVVLVGGIAATLGDRKLVPIRNRAPNVNKNDYPGVEWQATAIDNLLSGKRVEHVHQALRIGLTLVASFLAAAVSVLPRQVWLKLGGALLTAVAVVTLGVVLFRGQTIRWLPLAGPLTAIALSTVGAIAWSYFTEGRQRLFISKAFALSTSPVIAEAISKNPEKLKLGGERREITVMFTDLAGFTDLAETMEVVRLAQVINLYMEAMSEEIVRRDGYLDKYIGDAIMSFWNGLVDQPDHAARACRAAALGIKKRELEIAPELQKLVEAKIVTRIGVNTGPMAVGNLGSSRKLSYTVLGDAVNLGARLEPANKLYDTEVIVSQTTAEQVKGQFLMRELDLLAVKGKTIPMAVYELMAEGRANGEARARVEMYAAGLEHYRRQRWDEAEAAWNRLLKEFPTDGPSAKMLARVAKLRHESLPPDWDGVYRSKEK